MYDPLFLVLQYSSALEKNKLFVKNLPFTCTKEALETLFGEVSYELYIFCSPEPVLVVSNSVSLDQTALQLLW